MSAQLLAFREIRRVPARFALLVCSVALLAFLVVIQQGLLAGLVRQMNGGLRASDADLYVLGDTAEGALPASAVPDAAVGVARSVAGVADAGSVRFGSATVLVAGAETEVTLVGLDPGRPGGPARMVGGTALAADGEALISAADAGPDLAPGATVHARPADRPLRIVGLGGDANLGVIPTLYVPTATFVELAREQRPSALTPPPRSAVAVQLAGGADAAAVATALRHAIGGVDVLTRAQAADAFPGVKEVTHSFSVILTLLGIVVALVAGLFFMILTAQKAPTLTLLRASGLPARTLVTTLLLQVAAVVGGGAALGAIAAVALLSGADVGFDAGVGARGATLSIVSMTVLALVAALVPVRRILRIDPAAALVGGAP